MHNDLPLDRYCFGHHIMADEPAFAPRPGGSTKADGPVASAPLPHALPLGVRGNFHAN